MATKLLRRSRHHKKFTIPLAIVAGFVPIASDTWNSAKNWGWTGPDGGIAKAMIDLTSYNPYYMGGSPDLGALKTGLYPILLGIGGHWLASRLGINRMIAQAGIPVLRI
jgi:hypothetical protein